MEGFHQIALRPLRHYADFSGRSRRSELIAFVILLWLVNYVLVMALMAAALGGHDSLSFETLASWALNLALACPVAALAVRRLHDSGRSGWWALLALPGTALSLWQDFQLLRDGPAILFIETPLWERLAFATPSLILLVMLLWKDDPEPNRYGPNPRYDPPEPETTQPAARS
ncbi:MAG: hypothetical protein QOH04_1625 [Sphingomonadales bacterium]|nr:hypothetical protein [Sphingomonadales bacterium]